MKEKTNLPVQTVLELSCSAYRKLGRYIKENEVWFKDLNPKQAPSELPNKLLIQSTLRLFDWTDRMPPKDLVVTDEDRKLANEIRTFYRRLAFDVIAESNSFDSSIFSILNSEEMLENNIGFIAYLPSKYEKEYGRLRVKKTVKSCEEGFLGEIGESFFDLDSEILEVVKSKNFDAFNVTAIINNKMCSWMSKYQLETGPAVIVKAKVKDHSLHWLHHNSVTRLHYVKAAQ